MLTNFHRGLLLSYKSKQAKAPTLVRMVQGYWMVMIVLIVGALLASVILFALHLYPVAYLVMGGVLGWLIHTVWMYQKIVEGWPAVSQVLDWSKIDHLLNQSEIETNSAQPAASQGTGN